MRILCLVVVASLTLCDAYAQGARAQSQPAQQSGTSSAAGAASDNGDRVHARFRTGAHAGTRVDRFQAEALTLTLGAVSFRPIQNWIRTAGTIDTTGKGLDAFVNGPDAALVKPGQRVRAFPPSSKSSMYQAFVTRVVPR